MEITLTYYITKSTRGDLDAVVDAVAARVIDASEQKDFGVLTEIDVAKTLQTKLVLDFPNYRVLGGCNPTFAHQVLTLESRIGVVLPCKVIVRDQGDGGVEVSAIDPRGPMQQVGNPALGAIADEVAARLERVVASI
jgi:uncharacterized protein (DUF302 family)